MSQVDTPTPKRDWVIPLVALVVIALVIIGFIWIIIFDDSIFDDQIVIEDTYDIYEALDRKGVISCTYDFDLSEFQDLVELAFCGDKMALMIWRPGVDPVDDIRLSQALAVESGFVVTYVYGDNWSVDTWGDVDLAHEIAEALDGSVAISEPTIPTASEANEIALLAALTEWKDIQPRLTLFDDMTDDEVLVLASAVCSVADNWFIDDYGLWATEITSDPEKQADFMIMVDSIIFYMCPAARMGG